MKLARAARIILVGAPGVGTFTPQVYGRTGILTQLSFLQGRELKLSASFIDTHNSPRSQVVIFCDTMSDRRQPSVRLERANKRANLFHSLSNDLHFGKGLQAEKLMSSGSLVPDLMILRLILNELIGRKWIKDTQMAPYAVNSSSTSVDSLDEEDSAMLSAIRYKVNDEPDASYILDGFPRTAAQADKLDELVPINWVVHLDTPASIILDRIANRWVHAPSGRVYNTTFNPPKTPGKDDVTGESLTKRDDDKPEVWEKRLRNFSETSEPLLEHYDRQGVLWRVRGNSSDEISPKLFTAFNDRFCQVN